MSFCLASSAAAGLLPISKICFAFLTASVLLKPTPCGTLSRGLVNVAVVYLSTMLVFCSASASSCVCSSDRVVCFITFFTSSGDFCGATALEMNFFFFSSIPRSSSSSSVVLLANLDTLSFTLSKHSSDSATSTVTLHSGTNGPDVRIFLTSSAVEMNLVTLSDTLSRHSSDFKCSSSSSYSWRTKRFGVLVVGRSLSRFASSTNLDTFWLTLSSDSSSSVTRSRFVMRLARAARTSWSSTSVISQPMYSLLVSSRIGMLLTLGTCLGSSSGSCTVSG
uniref:(northern house mosquito) hypothetical protein n=1 Tax=Culex pipiens TaxID=7175 RepID=A0A8D8C9L9_CULPI